ncbi:MAG: PKD domain-containing protein [Candidatus Gracilibacteria bacterium]|nr:PKD domain-containing protein [Candidatus Gracilibacteria bacterium]
MKKLFIILVLIISQFILGNNTFSASIPVEEVFSDIDKNYKYYYELQALYDKGMIFPDEDGQFSPKKLLNRDEFVGISMEVSCKRCISPNTDFELLKSHSKTQTFYDVSKDNKYFYCIAESDKLGYVKGYSSGYQCEGKESIEGEKPFCIDNKITLDEALAVLLRNSGIFTIEDNKKVIEKIYSGEITKDLSDDVSAKDNLGQVYTFYGYLQKALEFELKEVDKNGNEKIYKLLEKINNKIYPYKHISKEDFLIISYIALKSNSCINEEELDLALKIDFINKNIDDQGDIFDLDSIIGGVCEKGIDNENYKWTFYNINSGTEIIKTGKYIENYKFLEKGKWRIILEVEDNCGKKGRTYSTIFIKGDGDGLNVQIEADPIIGNVELDVQFEGIIHGGSGDFSYRWDFKDGTKGIGKNPKNLFKTPGTYIVTLFVTDSDGNNGEATITIKVLDFDSCKIDADNDGIMDCDDKCPRVKGSLLNDGCPILNNSCGNDCSCQDGYECTNDNPNICQSEGICVIKNVFVEVPLNKCLEKGYNTFIYGNTVCTSCPCEYKLDFNAILRKCDLVFP